MSRTSLICILFLILALNCMAVSSYSQTVRMSMKIDNPNLREVMQEIKKQTEFDFLYNKDIEPLYLANTQIEVENGTIEDILNQLFKNSLIDYRIIDKTIVIMPRPVEKTSPVQQGITITGVVTDNNGEPLPGVGVMLKGTMQGTATDAKGAYSLAVPDGNTTLVFTFIGYTSQELAVGNRRSINVTLLEDTRLLEEVVVIGYGSIAKKDLTGSVGSVSSEDLVQRGTTSVMGAMQGAVAGVDISSQASRIGGGFDIQIRGQNSLEGGSPLYVVDGVVTDNIDFLNPADIERIDVLKDASSTAIYGSRGSNGVVLVKTKTGEGITKTVVSYDGYWGKRHVARIPDMMDGREWIYFVRSAAGGFNATTGRWASAPAQFSQLIHQRLYDEDYEDWIGLLMKNGQQQNHYINISGVSKDMSYNLGFGYQNEDGNYLNEEYNRYNVKIGVNHQPSKYFQSGANFNLSLNIFDAGSTHAYNRVILQPTLFHCYDADGVLNPYPGNADANGGTSFNSEANPLSEIMSGHQEQRLYNLVGSIYAQVSPIDGLSFKTTFSPQFVRRRDGTYQAVVPGIRTQDVGYQYNVESFNYTWDNQLLYTKSFGKHHLNATLLNSVFHTRTETAQLYAQDYPYKSYWYNISSGTVNPALCTSNYQETSMLSFAGRVNYDYQNKYLATATLRYDGSSRLANKRWSTFPSFALAWRLSEEEFMKAAWLSNLKARFSFGYSGNHTGVQPYGTQLRPITGSQVLYDYNGTVATGFSPGTPVNQDLTWEKTRESNFGIDFGLFKNRISGTIDVYDKLSDGLLMARRLAVESGVASMIDNIGSVSNRGIELSLRTINIKNNDFYWSTSLTFAHNKNAIVSLYGKKEDVVGEARFIGKPISVIYDYRILGIWTQAEYDAGQTIYKNSEGVTVYTARPGEAKTLDANGDGILNLDDRVILGSPMPQWTGGFTSNFQYRNWDFSFVLYAKQGVMMLNRYFAQFGYSGSRSSQKARFDYYVPPDVQVPDWDNFTVDGTTGNIVIGYRSSEEGHENARFPVFNNAGGGYYGNNAYYHNCSFVKVKNIVLGYNFDKKLIQKIGMSQLRLYVNVLNPFVFNSKDFIGWDPEYAGTQLNDGNGPSFITYQIGLNVKF